MNAHEKEIRNVITDLIKIKEIREIPIQPYSVFISVAGRVLLKSVYNQIAEIDKLDIADDVNNIIEFIHSDDNPNYNFSNGVSGCMWLLSYLSKKNLISLDEDFFDEIDSVLAVVAGNFLKVGCYDYFQGAGGIFITLLARPEKNKLLLEGLLEDLLNARVDYKGFKIWRFVFFSDKNPENFKISIGLSHGLPSLLVILGKLYKADIAPEKCLSAIKEIHSFLNSLKRQNHDDKNRSIYPGHLSLAEQASYITNLGWCYGDLGIASAFYLTGKNIGDKEMMAEGEDIFLYYSNFTIDTRERLKDACFCHGTVGVSHLFRRMYFNTGNSIFQYASEYWLAEALKMKSEGDELGYMFVGEDDIMEHRTNLLDGTDGICLVLSSYIVEQNPDWDECFLLS